ncbi:hypothetical protein [Paenacidovorax caeni]|uniref:hypothetical protein n=1 Tax=Paenacidovorax caeni TaxID=343013 RepID=UPI001113EA34|nr:hypothetical protein [Paenacidovorax caeni]
MKQSHNTISMRMLPRVAVRVGPSCPHVVQYMGALLAVSFLKMYHPMAASINNGMSPEPDISLFQWFVVNYLSWGRYMLPARRAGRCTPAPSSLRGRLSAIISSTSMTLSKPLSLVLSTTHEARNAGFFHGVPD